MLSCSNYEFDVVFIHNHILRNFLHAENNIVFVFNRFPLFFFMFQKRYWLQLSK